jgi:NADH-quinone oxidoreductase subunit J
MELYDIIFYLLAVLIVISAFIVVGSKNIVHSAYALLFTFLGVAGIYILLGSDFIGVTQLMVYVGGILVLLLFGIMLTNRVYSVEIKTASSYIIPSITIVGIFAAFLLFLMTETNWNVADPTFPETTVFSLGKTLLTQYSIIFEILAIVLLIALIGAATIARSDNKER